VAALWAAGGDDGLMHAAVVDVEVARVMGEDGRGSMLGDQGLDALGDVEQRQAVESIVGQVVEVYGLSAENATGGLSRRAPCGQIVASGAASEPRAPTPSARKAM
jgi:hypothetical protein